MVDRNRKVLLALSWLWIALVLAYSAWGTINGTGLFSWFAQFQIDRFGRYSEKLTAILPGLLLASPALWFVRRESAAAQSAKGQAPVGQADPIRRNTLIFGIVGGVAALVAVGAFLLSQTVPDGSEQAVPFDAATLGAGQAPTGKVLIRGYPVPEASTAVNEGGFDSGGVVYAGFRPDRELAKQAPLRLFIERRFSGDNAASQFFLRDQTGYLIENGLPDLALNDLRRRGIDVASPHYLLRTESTAKRDPYYIVAGVGGFFGLMLLSVAAIIALQTRSRRA